MDGTSASQRLKALSLFFLLIATAKPGYSADYTANFNGADIQTFVNIVGQNMGKTILIDPDVKASISVRSVDTFNKEEYYQFFLSVLDLYGFSLITLDNGLLKVVRSETVKNLPGKLTSNTQPGKGDELVTRIVSLENGLC